MNTPVFGLCILIWLVCVWLSIYSANKPDYKEAYAVSILGWFFACGAFIAAAF